jgi:hypothetical protein
MISTVDTIFSVSIDIALHHRPRHAVIRNYRPTHQASKHPTTSSPTDRNPLISYETPQALAADPVSPIKVGNGEQ